MKKFIVFIATAIIMAFTFNSCASKVEKDIKTIVGNDVKVCSVKSIDITESFYQYTEEYNRFLEENKKWSKDQVDWWAIKVKYENLFNNYPSVKQRCEKDYNDAVDSHKECSDSATYYYNKCKELENNNVGKIYVAKLLGRNEYTHKPNEYNSYSIFTYNTDGTIHPIDTGDNMGIIISVFPKAKGCIERISWYLQ